MTKKEKSKFNPFAQDLYPDEEILWFYTSPSSWDGIEMLKRAIRIASLFVFGFSLAVCAVFAVQALVLHDDMLLTISLGIAGFIIFYGLVMLYPFTLLRANRDHMYAVTNKRLLTCVAEKVTSLYVHDVDMLHISSSEEGHLFFSSSMPEWRDIPHPEDVIKIIQQARQDRIHRLEMAHEESHERKREEQVQSLRTDTASR